MAIENVQRNSTGVVKVTALDAIGNVLPEFAAAASDISITDGTNTYAVSSASWSNGIGLLNVTTPDVTGLKTLSLTVKGSATTLYPDPFQINLVDPYAGRFNTTGGKVIWDMNVTTDPTNSLTDYSGLGNIGFENDLSPLNRTAFTDTSEYKTSSTATPLVLGKYRWGQEQIGSTVTVPVGIAITDQTAVNTLCDQVTLENLPLKSLNLIYWQNHAANSERSIFYWAFRKVGDSGSTYNPLQIYRAGVDLGVSVIGAGVPVYVYNVFTKGANAIYFIGLSASVVGTTLSLKLYVDGSVYTGTANLLGNRSVGAGYTAFGNGALSLFGPDKFWTTTVGNKEAILDFCAYGDEKNADFFKTNAAAWGL